MPLSVGLTAIATQHNKTKLTQQMNICTFLRSSLLLCFCAQLLFSARPALFCVLFALLCFPHFPEFFCAPTMFSCAFLYTSALICAFSAPHSVFNNMPSTFLSTCAFNNVASLAAATPLATTVLTGFAFPKAVVMKVALAPLTLNV